MSLYPEVPKLSIEENIKPFGIKNPNKISFPVSALQSFLSLPKFIICINSIIEKKTTQPFFTELKKFIEEKYHNPTNFIRSLKTKYAITDNQFITFVDNFISELPKGKYEDLFYGKGVSIKECRKCEFPNGEDIKFKVVNLSFDNPFKIIFIPYQNDKNPINMFEMPDKRKNYVLMSEKANEFNIIKDISPEYPHIYAFELPEAGPSRGNLFAIIRLIRNGRFITEPMLCEVKRGHIPNKLTLKKSIRERIKNLFDARLKFEILSDLTFFMPSEDNPSICEQFISVNISEGSLRYNIKSANDKSAKLSLKSLFNGFIKLSLYDKEVKCNGCGKVSRPFARYRITDFPKIVVFRIDGYETQNSNLFQLQIPEFVAFGCDTNEYNTFDSLADPSLYKGLNISGVTLYELRAMINRNSNNQFTAAGKRGDKWYEFNDTLVNPVDDPSEASGTPYILFYESIGDEKLSRPLHEAQPSAQPPQAIAGVPNPTKQQIKYLHNSTRSMIANIDRSVQTNASEIIDFFRDKTKDPTISGFKYNGKTYRYGDTTSVNGIFPIGRKEGPQIELIVSNAAYRPSPPSSPQSPNNPASPSPTSPRPKVSPQPSADYPAAAHLYTHPLSPAVPSKKNASIAFIDYSSSMIACLNDSGVRRADVAIESVNRFLQAGRLFCPSDNVKFFDCIAEKPIAKFEEDSFGGSSDLLDILESAINHVNKKYKEDDYQRRIVIITDCIFPLDDKEDDIEDKKMEIFQQIIKEKIIIDLILLTENGEEEAKDFAAISHYSGGYICCPETPEEVYDFIEKEDFVNLSLRNLLPPEIRNCKFEMRRFDSIARSVKLITKPSIYKPFFYPEVTLVSPFGFFTEMHETGDDVVDRITKEIDISAYNQRVNNGAYSIYRILSREKQIEKRKAVVFLKSCGVLLMFLIVFPENYPSDEPCFKLLSNAKIEGEVSSSMFRIDMSDYTNETRLKVLLSKLNDRLKTCKVTPNKDDTLESFDQIEGRFYVQYGEREKSDGYFQKLEKVRRRYY